MIRQFVPSEYCLKCRLCCRFREANSVWSPCLLDEEIQGLIDKDLPAVNLSIDKRLVLVPDPAGEGFICPFLQVSQNSCVIYEQRPFECQLYPFLINLRNKKVILTVDLNCPYTREHADSLAFKEYVSYLSDFLNSPAQIKLLKENSQIIQAYEDVKEIIELKDLGQPH